MSLIDRAVLGLLMSNLEDAKKKIEDAGESMAYACQQFADAGEEAAAKDISEVVEMIHALYASVPEYRLQEDTGKFVRADTRKPWTTK